MDALFLEFLNRSLAASWLLLAVLLLRPLLKKAPKNLRCLLWGLAALRLLLPARLKSPLSLIPAAAPISVAPGVAPTLQSGFAAVDAALNPALAESFAPVPAAGADPAQIWLHIGAVVWLAGLAALLCYALVSYILLRRRMADAVLLHDNIYLSDKSGSPFVLGLLSPRIYLPFGMTEANMALVLAHEQGHITRHDHWWKPLGFALLAVSWFNPLAWPGYALFCRDIELACDEHVLAVLGPEAKKPYSRALLEQSFPHRRIAACPLAFGESDAKGRIKNVLSWKKPGFWVLLIGVLLCAALAVFFLTDPDDPLARPAESIERVIVSYDDTGLAFTIDDRDDLSRFSRALAKLSYTRSRSSEGTSGYRYRIDIQPHRLGGWNEFALNAPDTIRRGAFFYDVSGGEALYDLMEELHEKAVETGDRDVRSRFYYEIRRRETFNTNYGEPLHSADCAQRYGCPVVELPQVGDALTRMEDDFVWVWDDLAGTVRLKEIWYDDVDREALIVRWRPGSAEPDPVYAGGELADPDYDWAVTRFERTLLLDGTRLDIRYFSAEEKDKSYLDGLLSGLSLPFPLNTEALAFQLSQKPVTLQPGETIALERVFTLPDTLLASVSLPPEAKGILESYTDAAGRQMLRALMSSAETIPVTAEYAMGGTVSPFTVQMHVAGGMVRRLLVGEEVPAASVLGLPDEELSNIRLSPEAEGFLELYTDGGGRWILRPLKPSDTLLEVSADYFSKQLNDNALIIAHIQVISDADDAPLPIPEHESRLVTLLWEGRDLPVSELFGLPDEKLRGISFSDGSDGFLETYIDDEGRTILRPLKPSAKYLFEVTGEYESDSGSDSTRLTELVQIVPTDSVDALDICFFTVKLDEFTVHPGDAPLALYAADSATGVQVAAEWSVSNEEALALETLDDGSCTVAPKAPVEGGVTLTAAYHGVTRSVTVYVVP